MSKKDSTKEADHLATAVTALRAALEGAADGVVSTDEQGHIIGAAGSLITMLTGIYYAAQMVLFGAEFTQVYAQERGRGVRPAEYAVRVKRREMEFPPPPIDPTKSRNRAAGLSYWIS